MPNVYGRLPHTQDPRDYRVRVPRRYTSAYVDLSLAFTSVRDQLNLGACVSFGTLAAAEFAMLKAGADAPNLSELFLYYAARQRAGYPVTEDTGLEIRDGFASLRNDGAPAEQEWPYDTGRFAQRPPDAAYTDAQLHEALIYGAVAHDGVDDVIASGYPVVFGFEVFESFESQQVADTGVVPMPESGESPVAGHCMVFVSTPQDGRLIRGGIPGTLYRKARNSWSTQWGVGGYCWYPVQAMRYASDFWQVTTVGSPLAPVPPQHSAEATALAAVLREGNWVGKHGCCQARRIRIAARAWLQFEGL